MRGLRRAVWAALFAALVASCATVAPSTIRLPEVTVAGLSTEAGSDDIKVELRIANPNAFRLQFVGMDFKLGLNGRHLANGLVIRDLEIPAQSTVGLIVETTRAPPNLRRQLDSGTAAAYQIAGRLYLGPRLIQSIPFYSVASQ